MNKRLLALLITTMFVPFLADSALAREDYNGTRKTITRDLQQDVDSLEPGITITSLNYLNVQGTG